MDQAFCSRSGRVFDCSNSVGFSIADAIVDLKNQMVDHPCCAANSSNAKA